MLESARCALRGARHAGSSELVNVSRSLIVSPAKAGAYVAAARAGRDWQVLLPLLSFRLGPAMGPGLRREDDQNNPSLLIPSHPLRPSRQLLRSFLRMRDCLNPIKDLPHPE